jgi:hypothetical protein
VFGRPEAARSVDAFLLAYKKRDDECGGIKKKCKKAKNVEFEGRNILFWVKQVKKESGTNFQRPTKAGVCSDVADAYCSEGGWYC